MLPLLDSVHWNFAVDSRVPTSRFEDVDGRPRAPVLYGNIFDDLGPSTTRPKTLWRTGILRLSARVSTARFESRSPAS